MRRITVVGAVLVRDGRILAAQRGAGMSLAGKWEFPGGKIEPGETPEQSLRREIEEELGCEVTIGDRVCRTEHAYDFGLVDLATYWCQLTSGEPALTEHAAICWADADELGALDWAPADEPAVAAIVAARDQWS